VNLQSLAKVLIIEDNVPQALEMQETLQSAGFNVPEFVTHGADAIAMAKKEKPDVVLVDIKLPDADGIAVAEELQKLGFKVLFITADGTRATYQRALESKPVDFLPKPFSGRQLTESVKWALFGLGNLEREIHDIVPDSEAWLNTPNDSLGGVSPKEAIGTPREIDLRRLLRSTLQGLPA